jgi:hypothetical protein
MFKRYDITSEQDLRDAVTKVAAYVESLPGTPTVAVLRPVEGPPGENSDRTRTNMGPTRRRAAQPPDLAMVPAGCRSGVYPTGRLMARRRLLATLP